MDTSASSWFSELGMEDPFCSSDPYDMIMDFFDDHHQIQDLSATATFSTLINPVPIIPVPSSDVETPAVALERPSKQQKRSNTPIILTFGNPTVSETNFGPQLQTLNYHHQHEDDAVSEVLASRGSFTSLDEASKSAQPKRKKSSGGGGRRVRPASQTYDHIIAERKRREQLSLRFMALSAIVPGLKKMDKTSVLGDAITYLKQLKERVKTLEEQATKQTMESVVLVKRSKPIVVVEEDEGSSDETAAASGITENQWPLPEIEAKRCDKRVLLRIHCHNRKGVLVRLLFEVEKLSLAIANTNVAPFGNSAVDVTIIAEMEEEFNMTMEELVRCIRSAIDSPCNKMLE